MGLKYDGYGSLCVVETEKSGEVMAFEAGDEVIALAGFEAGDEVVFLEDLRAGDAVALTGFDTSCNVSVGLRFHRIWRNLYYFDIIIGMIFIWLHISLYWLVLMKS